MGRPPFLSLDVTWPQGRFTVGKKKFCIPPIKNIKKTAQYCIVIFSYKEVLKGHNYVYKINFNF